MLADLATVVAAFAVATALAALAGAESLGTALAFGQIAFAVTVVAVILRAPSGRV